ncbi:restriction endonuclease subunit S [candidate division TA06 bacterium]|nr:restriction endonuclease subunit S [candidate division TA06 bacterium]
MPKVAKKYKQTDIGLIPCDWEVKRLADIGTFKKGKGIRKDEVLPGGIPCIRYGELYTHHNEYVKTINSYINNDTAQNSQAIAKGDILFAGSGETKEEIGKCAAFLSEEITYAGGDVVILSPKECDSLYLGFLLNHPMIAKQKAQMGQGDAVVHIYPNGLSKILIPVPTKAEQTAIATALSDADALITSLEKLIAKKRLIKQGAMQKLLTPKNGWKAKKFKDIFIKHPSKLYQLNSTEYNVTGKYPIIDQGKNDLVGYSDNADKVFKCPTQGVIIFGDHTRIIKYVNVNFIVGADGTQLLSTIGDNNTRFFYYLLLTKEIPNTGYNRHFKYIRDMDFIIPILKEQTYIANILGDMDTEIAILETKYKKSKMFKQGMMQQLLTGKIRLV